MRNMVSRLAVVLVGCLMIATACLSSEESAVAPRTEQETVAPSSLAIATAEAIAAVDPDQIKAQLTSTASVQEASAEFAAVLGIDLGAVRVRIRPSGCTLCDMVEGGASPDGESVTEAAARVKAGSSFWLYVHSFTCYYQFDGVTITPDSCQFAPL